MNLPGLLLALCIYFPVTSGPFVDKLSEAEFGRLHEQLQASSEVPWRTIPWKISLLDAQRAALPKLASAAVQHQAQTGSI